MSSTILVCIPERMDSCLHPEAGHGVSSIMGQEQLSVALWGMRDLPPRSFLSTSRVPLERGVHPLLACDWLSGLGVLGCTRADHRDRADITVSFWRQQQQSEKTMTSDKRGLLIKPLAAGGLSLDGRVRI